MYDLSVDVDPVSSEPPMQGLDLLSHCRGFRVVMMVAPAVLDMRETPAVPEGMLCLVRGLHMWYFIRVRGLLRWVQDCILLNFNFVELVLW